MTLFEGDAKEGSALSNVPAIAGAEGMSGTDDAVVLTQFEGALIAATGEGFGGDTQDMSRLRGRDPFGGESKGLWHES